MRLFSTTLRGIAMLACLSSAPVMAADVDFSYVITDQDSQPVSDCKTVDKVDPRKCAEEVPLTLSRLAVGALLMPEAALSGDDQMRRWLLAQRIYRSGVQEVDASEIDLIKKQIAKRGWPISYVGQAWTILDPSSAKK